MNGLYDDVAQYDKQVCIKKCEETIKDMYGFEELENNDIHEFNFSKTIDLLKKKDKKINDEITFLESKKQDLNTLFTNLSVDLINNISYKETKDLIIKLKEKEITKQNLLDEVLIKYSAFLLIKNEITNNTKKL